MTTLTQITVPFHGAELLVIEHNNQPYTPMKPIVEAMGLDWAAQFNKLKQRFAKGIAEIAIPSNGGLQSMICLSVRKLFGWLMTISPNKVKPELRDKVIMYQNECDDVLWDYWMKGQAVNLRHTISPEQQDALHAIVDQRAGNNRKTRAEMWSRHNRHFNIAKYSQLLAIHFDDAKHYLKTIELKAENPQLPLLPIPFQQGRYLVVVDEEGTTIHDVSNYDCVEKGAIQKFYADQRKMYSDLYALISSPFLETMVIQNQKNKLPTITKLVHAK